ncbi:hypothetical protein DO021_16480 [Desulfobacter hydrogenophilus]|uniref:Uncharacterized protein n=1 Tax=Desulfobacter hydrogenophilus TaxID=2291 RepID=A0A328F8I7_9BACT|nr:hypothetical protein DO021_16480 [Desulfobacter hydrogenophilus]
MHRQQSPCEIFGMPFSNREGTHSHLFILIPDFPAIHTLNNHAFTIYKLFVEIYAFFSIKTLFNQMMRCNKTFFFPKSDKQLA